MRAIQQVNEFIKLHHYVQKYSRAMSHEVNLQVPVKGFQVEFITLPETDEIYMGFKHNRFGILYKKMIIVENGNAYLDGHTIVIGSKYAENLRDQFDEEVFAPAMDAISYEKIEKLQYMAVELNKMRRAQQMKKV